MRLSNVTLETQIKVRFSIMIITRTLKWVWKEEFEDTKGAIRIRISKIPNGQSESVYLRYQRGNQNPYMEEKQTTQWPKEKVQKDKQRSTKHTYKTKDQVTRTPLKTGGELRYSGGVSSSWNGLFFPVDR